MLRYAVFITLVASCASQQAGTTTLIVGGTAANIDNFPFTVSLQKVIDTFVNQLVCGGAIISREWIVTAAHCVDQYSPDELVIRAGSNGTYVGGQLYQVETYIQHPQFDKTTWDNDIAIVKVTTYFTFSSTMQPVMVATDDEVAPGANGIYAVWGSANPYNTEWNTLLQVQVPIMSNAVCQTFYSNYKITDGMVCAGFLQIQGDSCKGDTGGPLVVSGKLAGIASWAQDCTQQMLLAVNTRVAYYTEWIGDNLVV